MFAPRRSLAQIGSTNIAFPRSALGAAWGFMIGAAIMVVSVLAAGGWSHHVGGVKWTTRSGKKVPRAWT